MEYPDGSKIRLGDQVTISGKYKGLVVADIDGNEYSSSCPKEQWSYLNSGIVMDTDFGGLVPYQANGLSGEEIVFSSSSDAKP